MSSGHDGALYKRNRAQLRRNGEANNVPCFYCGMPIDYHARKAAPLSFTADHVIPVHAGGTDRMENLVPAHFRCNRVKSDNVMAPIRKTKWSAVKRWW